MMRNTNVAKVSALTIALALHGALAAALVTREPIEIEGGTGSSEVRLGSDFADMTAGTLSAITASETETITAETPETLTPEHITPIAPQTTVTAAQPVTTTGAATPTRPVPETVAATPAETGAVSRSIRPVRRSAEFEATHKQPAPRAKPATSNADRNARAGAATGQRTATAQQSGTTGRQQTAGNAAASNYPGLVMRRLSRAGKPRVNSNGTAVVAFTIAANGGLTSVSLARSSGSSALDQAALQLVRRAGPFPTPPTGARRSFSIQIEGR